MRLRLAILGVSLLAVLLAAAGPVMAKPTTFALQYYGIQYQWRGATWGGPFVDWSAISPYGWTDADGPFTQTGNSIHTVFTFSPDVVNLVGDSTNYVYDKSTGLWIQHEGTINYVVPCGPTSCYYGQEFPITSYWRGYMSFSGIPSQQTFERSVIYQWVYIYSPETDSSVVDNNPYATWDTTMGAWLVGYSVYIYDAHSDGRYLDGSLAFSFVEPVPASNYNPLQL